ncbi:hypothetical protein D3C80_2214450 [compost metagenome]
MKNEMKNRIAFGFSRLISNALRNGSDWSALLTGAVAAASPRAAQLRSAPRSMLKPIHAR